MTTNEITQAKKARSFVYKALASPAEDIDVSRRTVKGYLAAFDTIDEARDILQRGCFAKSIREHGPGSNGARKILHLYQHDHTVPLGRYRVLEEDGHGLYFEAEFDDIPKAREVLEQYKSGTLNQHSIGFWYIPDKMRYDDATDAFVIGELNLIEGSTVTFGCNENTPFLGFGSKNLFNTDISEIENLLAEQAGITLRGIAYEKQVELRRIIGNYQSLIRKQASPDELKALLKNDGSPHKMGINELFSK